MFKTRPALAGFKTAKVKVGSAEVSFNKESVKCQREEIINKIRVFMPLVPSYYKPDKHWQ